ncbi:putative F-box protein At3g24700 [Rutidosis leptorrhynchoides]|uniref:putative F-box protein At3g24700 n=1 Tax=Rutidosis leptorrhynchoides TaxID=125765 RepID=UPI003A9A0B17
MADNLPIEIQAEIIKHLPIKSLIRCTLLSKPFNAIIKSPSFITKHSVRYNQLHYLLARYETNMYHAFQQNYVPIIDNANFPQNKIPITVPDTVNRINAMLAFVLSSSHGLLCLYQSDNVDTKCFIWNPLIQRCIVIPIPNALHSVVVFGVCPNSCEIKLVKIRKYGNSATCNSVNWDVEVYTVSSGVWRTILSDKPRKSVDLTLNHVVINGITYFLAEDDSRNMFVTFDLTSEIIGELYLLDSLALLSGVLYLSTRMESLAVIDDHVEGEQQVCDVWILKPGVPNSTEIFFTFQTPKDSSDRVLGFRKNGDPILIRSAPSKGERFEVYNPSSEQFTDLDVFGNGNAMMVTTVHSLTETLLLIDQPNTILINDDDDEDDDEDDDDDAVENDGDNENNDADDDGNDDDDDATLPLIDMFQAN